jgi:hypothetical protein
MGLHSESFSDRQPSRGCLFNFNASFYAIAVRELVNCELLALSVEMPAFGAKETA